MARPRTLTDEERHARKVAYHKRYNERHREEIRAKAKVEYEKNRGEPKKRGKKPTPSVFALYRGDEFIDIGTKYELSAKYGIDPKTIYWCSTPAGKEAFYKHGGTGLTSVNLTKLEGVDL